MSSINPFTKKPYSANWHVLRKNAGALPVSQRLAQLLAAIKLNSIVIVEGETGSGKTTQLPQAIVLDQDLLKGGKKLALTQPRRLAAQLVAQRIAEELDVPLGGIVGLKYRDLDRTNKSTRLEVITDGSLIAAAKADPSLTAYGAIVVDEAHLHTTSTDLLLGLLKELTGTRPDLKIIVMSATMDAALFLNFFPGSVLEKVGGREHKVLQKYLAEPAQGVVEVVESILHVHLTGRTGNILVFVSGVLEMDTIIALVQNALYGPKARFGAHEIGALDCWALHAMLPTIDQDDAIETVAPAPRYAKNGRKLIIATNVAETSITLTGVTHVIDTCKYKSKVWNPRDESWCLREQWVSKAVAKQRAGRAGRTREGVAYRMCTQGGFQEDLMEHSVPAIMEGDMLQECLHILKMDRTPLDFPYIVAPATETIMKALGILQLLGAVDVRGELTDRGRFITHLPITPYSAVVLLESQQFDCSDEILSLVSMLEAQENGNRVFKKPSNKKEAAVLRNIRWYFSGGSGDHIMLFNIYVAWREACNADTQDSFLKDNMLNGSLLGTADQTRLQLIRLLSKNKSWKFCYLDQNRPDYHRQILKALAAGNFLRVARRVSLSEKYPYETVRHGASVKISSDSSFDGSHEWVIYNEYHSDGRADRTIRIVSGIAPEILISVQPNYWCNLEFLPKGPVRDSLAVVVSKMTGSTEDFVCGGMPKKPTGSQ